MFLCGSQIRFRIVLIVLALSLAFTAQFLFTGEVFTHFLDSNTWDWTIKFTFGTILLFTALACAAWVFLPKEKKYFKVAPPLIRNIDWGNPAWLVAAGSVYLLTQVLFFFLAENIIVDVLWIAGVGLLIIPVWLKNKPTLDNLNITVWEWSLVAAIALIGFILRYWNLTEIPSHVSNDVALMGHFSAQLINSGNFNWIGASASGHLLSYDQYLAWSMRLFGQNQYGIVMSSVILGTLSLPMVFLLGRELGGWPVGLTAASLLAIDYTHIHFSRILFGNSTTFFGLLAFYLLARGLRTHQPVWFGLAGINIGLALLVYDASRILPVIVVGMIAWQWLWQRDSFRANLKNWLFLVAGALAGFGPMLAYAFGNLHEFSGRGNTVMLWSPDIWKHELVSYQASNGFQVIVEQIWRTFLTPFLTGDSSPLFALQRPLVAPLVAVLFVIGAGFVVSRLKNDNYFMLASWVILTFILGGVLTYDPPFWPHLIITLPAFSIIAALGAVKSIALTAPFIGRYGNKLLGSVLTVAILTTGVVNWNAYYSVVKNNAAPKMRISRYITSLPQAYRVYMLSTDFSWNEFTFKFFNRDRNGQDLTPEEFQSKPPLPDQPAIFILFNHTELLPVLQALYPGGEMIEHLDFNNNLSFISYKITPPGAVLPSPNLDFHMVDLPGWWIVAGIFLAGLLRTGFLFLKRRKNESSPFLNAA